MSGPGITVMIAVEILSARSIVTIGSEAPVLLSSKMVWRSAW